MQNFVFFNPTKIVFGKNTIQNLSEEIPKDAKILMTYGGGSIKKNGVYDQVKQALKSVVLKDLNDVARHVPKHFFHGCKFESD